MGIGKQATAHTIACCAEAYGSRGYQYVTAHISNWLKWLTRRLNSFYYVDERKEDGQPAMGGIHGPAHGDSCMCNIPSYFIAAFCVLIWALH